MREIRLYSDQSLNTGTVIELEEAAAHHLARVLRGRVGDNIILFNGDGFDWQCRIGQIDKRRVEVTVGTATPINSESPITFKLGLCLSKGDRFDWAIQKATELGVASITPLISARVEVKLPAERVGKRHAHWQQIVTSACEQSGRVVVPTVAKPLSLAEWAKAQVADIKLVLHHREAGSLPTRAPSSVALLIGPEGGFAVADLDYAKAAGFQNLNLGPRVLRTETAPAAALSALGALWGDLVSN